jgi:hypothetical protein
MVFSRALAALVGAAALSTLGMGSAGARPAQALTCSGGQISSGTYSRIMVTGDCTVPDGANVVVRHNVVVAPNASFDAVSHSTVTIYGNLTAGAGSFVGLGCTPAHGCDGDAETTTSTHDFVGHNVVLHGVFNAALNGDHIGGNLISTGGGAGTDFPGFIPFSVKDDTIDKNVVVTGLSTIWFGVIRSTIGGNVVLQNIQLGDPDGDEVVANTIGKNLICSGNNPAPQFGDAVEEGPPGYGPNTVGGKAIGQCVGLTG